VTSNNGFINFLLHSDNPWVTSAVRTSILCTTPFLFDYFYMIQDHQSHFLQSCAFLLPFYFQNFHENFHCFSTIPLRPPSYSLACYLHKAEYQINTFLYVGNIKHLSEGGHSSKVARHGITSMYFSVFRDDCMRSVNPHNFGAKCRIQGVCKRAPPVASIDCNKLNASWA
jgi:hypothetical protein